MARTIADIEKELMALPTQERARLAHDLIVSLNEEEEKLSKEEREAAWREEIEWREQEFKAGRAEPVEAELVIGELKAKYQKK